MNFYENCLNMKLSIIEILKKSLVTVTSGKNASGFSYFVTFKLFNMKKIVWIPQHIR